MEDWRTLALWTASTCWPVAVAALVGINLLTFWLYGYDKRLAEAGERRISEATLLDAAIFGGSIGACLACRFYRHKTRKQPFANRLQTITVVQLAIVAGLAIAFMPV